MLGFDSAIRPNCYNIKVAEAKIPIICDEKENSYSL